ncbi:hypothetical protein D3C71_1506410 [compost metagenome]
MALVDLCDGIRHVNGGSHSQLGMIGSGDRGAPKRHHTVTHVFVDGAPVASDDVGEFAEHVVQQGLQLQWLHAFGHGGEPPHVAEHDRQLSAGGLHAVVLGLLDHFVHQFWRHIGSEECGQFAF